MASNFTPSQVQRLLWSIDSKYILYTGNHRLLAKRERVDAAIKSGDQAERDRHGFAYFRYVSM